MTDAAGSRGKAATPSTGGGPPAFPEAAATLAAPPSQASGTKDDGKEQKQKAKSPSAAKRTPSPTTAEQQQEQRVDKLGQELQELHEDLTRAAASPPDNSKRASGTSKREHKLLEGLEDEAPAISSISRTAGSASSPATMNAVKMSIPPPGSAAAGETQQHLIVQPLGATGPAITSSTTRRRRSSQISSGSRRASKGKHQPQTSSPHFAASIQSPHHQHHAGHQTDFASSLRERETFANANWTSSSTTSLSRLDRRNALGMNISMNVEKGIPLSGRIVVIQEIDAYRGLTWFAWVFHLLTLIQIFVASYCWYGPLTAFIILGVCFFCLVKYKQWSVAISLYAEITTLWCIIMGMVHMKGFLSTAGEVVKPAGNANGVLGGGAALVDEDASAFGAGGGTMDFVSQQFGGGGGGTPASSQSGSVPASVWSAFTSSSTPAPPKQGFFFTLLTTYVLSKSWLWNLLSRSIIFGWLMLLAYLNADVKFVDYYEAEYSNFRVTMRKLLEEEEDESEEVGPAAVVADVDAAAGGETGAAMEDETGDEGRREAALQHELARMDSRERATTMPNLMKKPGASSGRHLSFEVNPERTASSASDSKQTSASASSEEEDTIMMMRQHEQSLAISSSASSSVGGATDSAVSSPRGAGEETLASGPELYDRGELLGETEGQQEEQREMQLRARRGVAATSTSPAAPASHGSSPLTPSKLQHLSLPTSKFLPASAEFQYLSEKANQLQSFTEKAKERAFSQKELFERQAHNTFLFLHKCTRFLEDNFKSLFWYPLLNKKILGQVSFPRPQEPIVLNFNSDELHLLAKMKRKLRHLDEKIFVGGYYPEYLMSALLPSRVYNSKVFRRLIVHILDHVLPCCFLLAAVHHFYHFIMHKVQFFGRLETDPLVILLSSVDDNLPLFLTPIWRLNSPLLSYPPFSWIGHFFQTLYTLLTETIHVIWIFVLPIDEFLTYLRARWNSLLNFVRPFKQVLYDPVVLFVGMLKEPVRMVVGMLPNATQFVSYAFEVMQTKVVWGIPVSGRSLGWWRWVSDSFLLFYEFSGLKSACEKYVMPVYYRKFGKKEGGAEGSCASEDVVGGGGKNAGATSGGNNGNGSGGGRTNCASPRAALSPETKSPSPSARKRLLSEEDDGAASGASADSPPRPLTVFESYDRGLKNTVVFREGKKSSAATTDGSRDSAEDDFARVKISGQEPGENRGDEGRASAAESPAAKTSNFLLTRTDFSHQSQSPRSPARLETRLQTQTSSISVLEDGEQPQKNQTPRGAEHEDKSVGEKMEGALQEFASDLHSDTGGKRTSSCSLQAEDDHEDVVQPKSRRSRNSISTVSRASAARVLTRRLSAALDVWPVEAPETASSQPEVISAPSKELPPLPLHLVVKEAEHTEPTASGRQNFLPRDEPAGENSEVPPTPDSVVVEEKKGCDEPS